VRDFGPAAATALLTRSDAVEVGFDACAKHLAALVGGGSTSRVALPRGQRISSANAMVLAASRTCTVDRGLRRRGS